MESRTSNSIRNIKVTIVCQIFGIILNLVSRYIFVRILTAEYLGLSGLFTNILTVLSMTDLGFGTAMSYQLYKPISEKKVKKIKGLMLLYRKIYTIIGLSIIFLGVCTIPIYPMLINNLPDIKNLDLIYMLFVINSAITYFFSYKRILLISDQKKYIDIIYKYFFMFLLNILQIIGLIITHNYIAYLIIQIITTCLENISISIKINKLYPYLKDNKNVKINKKDKKELFTSVKYLFFHKFGGIVLNSTDNIVTSKYIGLVVVGLYSNYYLIFNALHGMISQLYNSVVASIGNLNVETNRKKMTNTFNKMFFVNFWIYHFTSISLLFLINPFIVIWLGEDYLLSTFTVIILVINYYIFGMRKTAMSFRYATGNYKNDWYSPIIEAVINVGVSIILAKYIGIAGVFLGTIISSLCTNFWFEPLVICKKSLAITLKDYFNQYFKYFVVTLSNIGFVWAILHFFADYTFINFLIKIIIVAIIPNIIVILLYYHNENFIYFKDMFLNKLNSILNKKFKNKEIKN